MRASSPGGPDQLIHRRCTGHAKYQLAPVHQGDLGGKHAVTADKALGPVYGVNQPKIFGVLVLASILFTEDSMLGKRRGDDFPDGAFGRTVSHGDGRLVRLDLHIETAMVIGENDFLCRAGSIQCNREKRAH